MSQKAVSTFFDKKASETYDERNSKLTSIIKNLHFLTQLVLEKLPADAHILCVGVGTGEEIIALANTHSDWKFTGIEPSAPMCYICQKKIEDAGLASRCTIVNGYLPDIDEAPKFDAVLCFLVTHFITDHADRQGIFTGMYARLKPGGYLINADISDDTQSPEFKSIMEKWKAMHRLSGASEQALENMESSMRNHLSILPKSEMESFLLKAGFGLPVQFFQSLLIRAWYSKKD